MVTIQLEHRRALKLDFILFYLPDGLFNNNISLPSAQKCKFARVVYSSELYQKKYAALGIPIHYKKGSTHGMGNPREGSPREGSSGTWTEQ